MSNETSQSQLFAVPEGGWSSINVLVQYEESYTTDAYYNTFYERERIVSFKRAYATTCPVVSLLNVKHELDENEHYFETWVKGDIMYSPNTWDGCTLERNYDSMMYSRLLNVKGMQPFILACNNAIPAMASGTVELNLKVN